MFKLSDIISLFSVLTQDTTFQKLQRFSHKYLLTYRGLICINCWHSYTGNFCLFNNTTY